MYTNFLGLTLFYSHILILEMLPPTQSKICVKEDLRVFRIKCVLFLLWVIQYKYTFNTDYTIYQHSRIPLNLKLQKTITNIQFYFKG